MAGSISAKGSYSAIEREGIAVMFADMHTIIVQALSLLGVFCAIPLGVSLCIGLLLATLQAATQIQEQTLTFVPKLAAVAAALFFAGPLCAPKLAEFLESILLGVPEIQRLW